MKVLVRKATLNDIKEVQALNKEFLTHMQNFEPWVDPNWSFGEGINYFKDKISKDDFGCIMLAIVDGVASGYLAGGIAKDTIKGNQKTGEIENLIVTEKFRRISVGTKLIEGFFGWCKEKNVAEVEVSVSSKNLSARKFYEKKGFSCKQTILKKGFCDQTIKLEKNI
jgi:ribosomal protein S18 acetylase RimI-like enzyme